jgi:hypothetical protein
VETVDQDSAIFSLGFLFFKFYTRIKKKIKLTSLLNQLLSSLLLLFANLLLGEFRLWWRGSPVLLSLV